MKKVNSDCKKEDIANELKERVQELAYQNEEKEKRAAELVVANKELAFQNKEKADRAAELIIANKELAYQNEEKDKRAAELVIANRGVANISDKTHVKGFSDKTLDFVSKLLCKHFWLFLCTAQYKGP